MNESHEHHHAHAGERRRQAAATAIDPVCGMTVRLDAGKPTFEHEGATYHFCSQGCRTKFAADPERYLQASPDRAAMQGMRRTTMARATPRP